MLADGISWKLKMSHRMAACLYADDPPADLEIASEAPISLALRRVDPCLSSMQFA